MGPEDHNSTDGTGKTHIPRRRGTAARSAGEAAQGDVDGVNYGGVHKSVKLLIIPDSVDMKKNPQNEPEKWILDISFEIDQISYRVIKSPISAQLGEFLSAS